MDLNLESDLREYIQNFQSEHMFFVPLEDVSRHS